MLILLLVIILATFVLNCGSSHVKHRTVTAGDETDDQIKELKSIIDSSMHKNTGESLIVFLTGKYASGKSYLARELMSAYPDDTAYVELDDIIVKEVYNKHPGISRDDAFTVYTGHARPEFMRSYVEGVDAAITTANSDGKRLIIMDGAQPGVLKLIRPNAQNYIVACLVITSLEKHKERIIKRIKNDIAKGTKTLPQYWDPPNPKMDRVAVKVAIENGENIGEKFAEFIDKEAAETMAASVARCRKFHDEFYPNYMSINV